MFRKLKKLNSAAFTHLQLILVAVLVIGAIAGVGTYVISQSKAAKKLSNKWADCYTQWMDFWVIARQGDADASFKGPAVDYIVIELDKFARKRFYGNEAILKYKYPKVEKKTWRTATFSLYCPNAKNPKTGSHWRTEVRGAWQLP